MAAEEREEAFTGGGLRHGVMAAQEGGGGQWRLVDAFLASMTKRNLVGERPSAYFHNEGASFDR